MCTTEDKIRFKFDININININLVDDDDGDGMSLLDLLSADKTVKKPESILYSSKNLLNFLFTLNSLP